MAATFVERRGAAVARETGDTARPVPGIGFVVAWMAALALANAVAGLVEAGLFAGLRGAGMGATTTFWMGFWGSAVNGLALGVTTGLVLRRHLPYWRTWTLATAFGTALAYALGLAVVLAATFNAGSRAGLSTFSAAWMAASPLVLQLVVTSFQWLVLRRAVRRAWIWVIVATLATAVVSIGYSLGVQLAGGPGPLELAAMGVVGGLIAGAVTGPTMAWLIRGRSFRRA
jgi:hypothetical protein